MRELPFAFFMTLATTSTCFMGCGDDDSTDGAGAGGTAGTFGAGGLGAGGQVAAGGAVASGGATAAGGAAAGGMPAMGGQVGAGGSMGGADGSGGAGGEMPAAGAVTAGGAWQPFEAYTDLGASGFALLIRKPDGQTETSVQVSGLEASTMYPAHVHALPCGVADAGGALAGPHYKIDPTVMDTVETNELWVAFTTDAEGNATSVATAMHAARPDAMSVVIHDPATDPPARMLCADLVTTDPDPATATGTFAPFAAAEAGDQTIAGTATLDRTATATTVSIDVMGLSDAETYAAHVHALPCALSEADGHYKLDLSVADAEEMNELWPMFTPGMTSVTNSFTRDTHRARPDAMSLVIHRQTTDAAIKVACADLKRTDYLAFKTEGTFERFEDAPDHEELAGTATMERTLDGNTVVTVNVTGLTASAEYPAHVHDHACSAAKGGGHYKLDDSVADTMETNEIWVGFTADADGMGTATAMAMGHVARAAAQSIVIHSPDDSAVRLGCADLAP